MNIDHTQDLIKSWKESPYPSTKLTSYFSAYAELFSHLRGKKCVFVETGVLAGGSLFMWREWLGPDARIIGVDLNPESEQWRDYGFEIIIGDQGDPNFWASAFQEIRHFDAFLDDGGHQSFQQIVTLNAAIENAVKKCVVVVEDTHTSFMRDFSAHGEHHFLNYSKACTDVITAKGCGMYPGRMQSVVNKKIIDQFRKVHSIQFFNSMVAFKIDPENSLIPQSTYNHVGKTPSDFRYRGASAAIALWPDPFSINEINIAGGII